MNDATYLLIGVVTALVALGGLGFMLSRRSDYQMTGCMLAAPFIIFMLWLTFVVGR